MEYWLGAAAILFVLSWVWTLMAIRLWREEGRRHESQKKE